MTEQNRIPSCNRSRTAGGEGTGAQDDARGDCACGDSWLDRCCQRIQPVRGNKKAAPVSSSANASGVAQRATGVELRDATAIAGPARRRGTPTPAAVGCGHAAASGRRGRSRTRVHQRRADDRGAAGHDLRRQPKCSAAHLQCLPGPGRGQTEERWHEKSRNRTPSTAARWRLISRVPANTAPRGTIRRWLRRTRASCPSEHGRSRRAPSRRRRKSARESASVSRQKPTPKPIQWLPIRSISTRAVSTGYSRARFSKASSPTTSTAVSAGRFWSC